MIIKIKIRTNVCAGCLQKKYDGAHEAEGTSEWNYKQCTKLEPTDAYGKLTFPGSHTKTASVRQIVNQKIISFNFYFK